MSTLVANDVMAGENTARLEAAHSDWRAAQAARKAAEADRVTATRTCREKQLRTRSTLLVVEERGTRRTARKVVTLCDKMLRSGQLPKHLKIAVDVFASLVAAGTGAATDDHDDSTNKLTCGYEPVATLGGFGSKALRDQQLAGLTAVREVRTRIPDELMPIFKVILAEETGVSETKKSLITIGEEFGYRYKQSAPAGAMAVLAVAAIINLYLRERGITSRNIRRF